MAKKRTPKNIFQIKVTLLGSKPPIWRRLLVADITNLYDLNRIIQVAMGWTNSHLHQFIINGAYYSIPSPDDYKPVIDERKYLLGIIAPVEKTTFIYQYDFGDNWEHEILVEKILPADPVGKYPVCLTGKRACPPEDVGGIWSYQGFLEAINDPQHEEHESYLEWVGGEFDPVYFDLKDINTQLRQIDKLFLWDNDF